MTGYEKVCQLLSSSIPRDFLLNLQRFVPLALERALVTGARAHEDHRSTLEGHARHLFLNEALMSSFEECGIPHPKLRGNTVMLGKVGLVTLGRIHMNKCKWDNSRRSKNKRELCRQNYRAKLMVQADLFDCEKDVDEVTVFVVTEGSGDGGPAPIYIVVPDETLDLRNPVLKEEIHIFLQRYEKIQDVVDIARPKLKSSVQQVSGDNNQPEEER